MCSLGVFAFLGVGAWVGARGSLCFGRLALALTCRVWAALACARWRVLGWAARWGGTIMSRPYSVVAPPMRAPGRGGVLTEW